jgi:hypothetical protein
VEGCSEIYEGRDREQRGGRLTERLTPPREEGVEGKGRNFTKIIYNSRAVREGE